RGVFRPVLSLPALPTEELHASGRPAGRLAPVVWLAGALAATNQRHPPAHRKTAKTPQNLFGESNHDAHILLFRLAGWSACEHDLGPSNRSRRVALRPHRGTATRDVR